MGLRLRDAALHSAAAWSCPRTVWAIGGLESNQKTSDHSFRAAVAPAYGSRTLGRRGQANRPATNDYPAELPEIRSNWAKAKAPANSRPEQLPMRMVPK